MTPARTPRRRLVAVTLAIGAGMMMVSLHAQVALAQAPVRVGWWNTFSAPGLAAPAPTTPAGGIRVSAAPGQVLAFGAVLYRAPLGSTAKLTLKIAGAQGTPQVQACPTKNTKWKGGDDQSADAAPAYDCTTLHAPGTVSSNATKITFKMDVLTEPRPGRLSLAIVPDLSGSTGPAPGVNTPFSVDFDKPTSKSLTVSTPPPPPPPPQPVPPPASASGGTSAPVQPPSSTSASVPGAPLGVPSFTGSSTTQTTTRTVQTIGTTPQGTPSPGPVAGFALPAQAHGIRMTAASVVGGVALAVALLLWGMGYGLLGSRVIPLSVPLPRGGAAARRSRGPGPQPSRVRAPTGQLLR